MSKKRVDPEAEYNGYIAKYSKGYTIEELEAEIEKVNNEMYSIRHYADKLDRELHYERPTLESGEIVSSILIWSGACLALKNKAVFFIAVLLMLSAVIYAIRERKRFEDFRAEKRKIKRIYCESLKRELQVHAIEQCISNKLS